MKYNADEARSLKAYRDLPGHTKINEAGTFGAGDGDGTHSDDFRSGDEATGGIKFSFYTVM